MPTTPLSGFPYPALSEPPNGPAAFQALAEAVEQRAIIVCTSTTRPASPDQGMVIYETDTDRIYAYSGTAFPEWSLVWDANEIVPEYGQVTVAFDGGGAGTIPHTLGVVPRSVQVTRTNFFGQSDQVFWDPALTTTSVLAVRISGLANTSRDVSWVAYP